MNHNIKMNPVGATRNKIKEKKKRDFQLEIALFSFYRNLAQQAENQIAASFATGSKFLSPILSPLVR